MRSRNSRKKINKKINKKNNKKINKSLYDNGTHKPRIKAGYGNEKIAKQTISRLKKLKSKNKKNDAYIKQIVNTMYNRAKYHKYRTKDMEKAMKVYKKFYKSGKKSGKKS